MMNPNNITRVTVGAFFILGLNYQLCFSGNELYRGGANSEVVINGDQVLYKTNDSATSASRGFFDNSTNNHMLFHDNQGTLGSTGNSTPLPSTPTRPQPTQADQSGGRDATPPSVPPVNPGNPLIGRPDVADINPIATNPDISKNPGVTIRPIMIAEPGGEPIGIIPLEPIATPGGTFGTQTPGNTAGRPNETVAIPGETVSIPGGNVGVHTQEPTTPGGTNQTPTRSIIRTIIGMFGE